MKSEAIVTSARMQELLTAERKLKEILEPTDEMKLAAAKALFEDEQNSWRETASDGLPEEWDEAPDEVRAVYVQIVEVVLKVVTNA